MVDYFKMHVKDVRAFLIVLNGAQSRLDAHLREMIDLFSSVFDQMWENTLIVFTRWAADDRSVEVREKSGDSKEKKKAELNAYIKANYKNIPKAGVPVVFIDNYPDPKNPQEQSEFKEAVHKVRDFVVKKRRNKYNIKKIQKDALEVLNTYD